MSGLGSPYFYLYLGRPLNKVDSWEFTCDKKTTAMSFSFKYGIDLEEYSEYSYMVIAVEGVVKTKALTGCQEQDRGVPSKH